MQSLNNCMNIFRRMLKMANAPGCHHSIFLVRAKTSSAPCHPLPINPPFPRESAKRAVKSVGACLLTCSQTCKAVAIPGAPRRACPARPTCTHVPFRRLPSSSLPAPTVAARLYKRVLCTENKRLLEFYRTLCIGHTA